MRTLSFCLLMSAAMTAQVVYAQKISPRYVDGEIYIKLKDDKSVPTSNNGQVNMAAELPFLSRLSNNFSFTASRRAFYFSKSERLQRVYRVKITESNRVKELMSAILTEPDVEYVELVPLNKKILTPNDPSFGTQYHLATIQAPAAWDVSTGVSNVVVAVVDDAVQTNHPDLAANCVSGYDVADNDTDPIPPNTNLSHGTHVAGIVGAVTNNGIGIASVGYNKVKIMGVKCTGDNQNPDFIYFGYEGVTWAANNGAKVINMSWGGGGFSQTAQDVINAASALGVVLVAAAGNSNNSSPLYPSAYNNVIAVASTDALDKKSSFSNFGSYVDIAAPGTGIYSTIPFNGYATYSGTSMASPLAASLCGFLLSNNNTLTPAQVEQIIKNTADNIDTQNPNFVGLLGAGRINVLKALNCQNNLFTATITTPGAAALCAGQTIMLTANLSGSGTASYQWQKGNTNVGTNSPTLMVADTGVYRVVATRANCSIKATPVAVVVNPFSSATPTVTNRSVCSGGSLSVGNGLQVSAPNCILGGPATFAYSGGSVGYDDGNSSGPNPTASIFGLVGAVTNVSVSIVWEKKNQNNQGSCALPHLGGNPWNGEVSFQLRSPNGTTINLLYPSTYTNNGYGGVVTTVFQTGAPAITTGSIPSSGTFAPAQPLSDFNGTSPTGIWTLLPNDNSAIDPLCVQGFSVTIITNATATLPSYSWWSAATGGTLLATGSEYIPAPTTSNQVYYAQSQCTGACPSVRVPVTLTVSRPQITAFPVTFAGFSTQTLNGLLAAPATTFTNLPNGSYQLQNLESNQTIIIAQRPPFVEPITVCSGQNLLLLAHGCTNTATWSNAASGIGIFVSPTATTTYTTTCEVSGCPSIASESLVVHVKATAATVTAPIPANALQTFRAITLTGQNSISNTANINYIGGQQVVLLPGFTATTGAIFKAEIGSDCSN